MTEQKHAPLAVNIGQEDGFFLVGQTDSVGFIITRPAFKVQRPKNSAEDAKVSDMLAAMVKACNEHEWLVALIADLWDAAKDHLYDNCGDYYALKSMVERVTR